MGFFSPFLFVAGLWHWKNCWSQLWKEWVYELVEVEQLARNKLLRIFVDKEGGITIDDCVAISNHLSRLLVVENIDYGRLEVSSPGLDRPLRKEVDFLRFKGETD